jgi:hypothetical protein
VLQRAHVLDFLSGLEAKYLNTKSPSVAASTTKLTLAKFPAYKILMELKKEAEKKALRRNP